jgi:DNA-binding response OmpR family regulator
MKILVIEDEPKLNKSLVEGLEKRGYAADFALDGEEGEQLAKYGNYDLIILDVMMPKRDGIAVCRNLRLQGYTTPIIFLTAKDAIDDRILGLDGGADDYLVKPFAFDELIARIRALMRRPALTASDVLTLDELTLDTRTQSVQIENKPVELTLREYGMLEYFLRNKNAVVTREDILEHVWDKFHDLFSNVVDVHLKNLRKKLPYKYARRIKTVWGKGYQLV